MDNYRDSYRGSRQTGDYSRYQDSGRERDTRERDTRGRDPRYNNPRDNYPRDSYQSNNYRERDPRDRDPRDRDPRGTGSRQWEQRDQNRPRYNNGHNYREGGTSYRPRNDRLNSRENTPRGRDQEHYVDPDANLSKEEIIKKYERKLALLLQYDTIDKFPLVGSQWGVKPKGFEKITAQRAKLSGLFPLPGAPRPVDVTKLDGNLAGTGDPSLLIATSKIDPLDSRNSTIIIVKNIDFLLIDYRKVAEHFNKFIRSVDVDSTSVENNISKRTKTKDDKNLIIEFTNNTCATLALTLNGTKLLGSQVSMSDSSAPPSDVVLNLHRPGEYVVQSLPPYDAMNEDIAEEVVDSPRKLTLHIDKTATESMLQDALSTVAKLKAFKLLREVGTKESLGLAFVEYYVDPRKHSSTKMALALTVDYVEKTKELEMVHDVQFSCVTMNQYNVLETSVQDCPIELKTLRALVRNEYVPFHPKLRVIQLINIVTAADMFDDASFLFIQQDILEEAKSFGNVRSIKIPRPAHDFTPGIVNLNQPGVGKVYIEFDDEKIALNAIMGLGGRSYNDRTVLCAFYSQDDYLMGML